MEETETERISIGNRALGRVNDLLERLGQEVLWRIEEVGQFLLMAFQAVVWTFRPPYRFYLTFKQMEFVGLKSVGIIVLTGLFTGMVFTLQGVHMFKQMGMEGLVGSTVGLTLSRELSPVFCGLMVTARAGSAMAAELGTMRVTQQIDAMEAMAVNPVDYLVVPRLIAGVTMLPVLTMLFNIVGILGSYVLGVVSRGIDKGAFINNVRWYVDPDDIINGLWKAAAFGFIIALVGCFKGFYTKGGAEGVGRATTRAVVISSVAIFIADYFLTDLLFHDIRADILPSDATFLPGFE